MTTQTAEKPLLFVPDLFHYNRRKTREVSIGSVGVGGNNPIRLQSMTTTPTTDVAGTIAQSIRMIEAGCEIVRVTAPKIADARALGDIRKGLDAKGFAKVPLVADIHFNPDCAMEAANHVEKIRVNPGNYADSKAFKTVEYTDNQYEAELARLEERFMPLLLKCKQLNRAMRIGCNHGSLSDRIMNRYGDSPLGMVEAALEFVRICRKNDYHSLVLSMKASNPKVMIAAYRLLVARMDAEGFDYPLHLGVTEAGYGEDGRIKSAIGIGSLLCDGIGDTVRVSLTEDPEFEIPVAEQIVRVACAHPSAEGVEEAGTDALPFKDAYSYVRRATRPLRVGPFTIGGEHTTRVFMDLSHLEPSPILNLLENQLKSGKDMVPEILEWPMPDEAALARYVAVRRALKTETSRLAFLGRFSDITLAEKMLAQTDLAYFEAPRGFSGPERINQFRRFLKAAKAAGVPVMLESGPCDRGRLEPGRNLVRGVQIAQEEGVTDLVLSLNLPSVSDIVANARLTVALLGTAAYPFHLRYPGREFYDDLRLEASIAFGSLLCDGIGDSVQIATSVDPKRDLELVYNILQGAGTRITKTEFVSCPSCGRTLFDLQSTTERIKQKTGHLKGVKIAIMGCIVNGPGEMADADFGYVGGAPGKINLYVGKACVEKGIPFEASDERLIQLIKSHGKWVEPK